MIQGHFDAISGREVCGWLWDKTQPDTPVMARVFIDSECICEGIANRPRPDLQALGMGNGFHGFHIPLPDTYLQGQSVKFEVRGPDNRPIGNSPQQLQLPLLALRPLSAIPNYPIKLAIVSMVRDEAPYLLEWFAWHRLIGVERFVMFDNESTDGTTELLAAFAKQGFVEHIRWPSIEGASAQIPAYVAGLARLEARCQWVAIIDADEFLNPLRDETLPQILDDYAAAGGMVVPWRSFGSSGLKKRSDELVISRFTRRIRDDHHLNGMVKSIVRPWLVAKAGVHSSRLHTGSLIDEFGVVAGIKGHPDHHVVANPQRLVLNHYFTKSHEEWQQKRLRGRADLAKGSIGWQRAESEFASYDTNDIQDLRMAARAPEVLAEMQRLRALLGQTGNR